MSKHKQPGGIWTAQYAHCALWINEKWDIKAIICQTVAIIMTTIMVAAILMNIITRAILTTTNTDDKRNH